MSLDSSSHFHDAEMAPVAWDVPATPSLHVVLAEEAEILREGFKVSLQALGQPVVIHEAASWDELLLVAGQVLKVDLLVLDEGLIPSGGSEDLATLSSFTGSAPAVVVTSAENGGRMRHLLRQGARGYLSKKVGSRVFTGALKLVLDGGIYVSPEALMAPEASADEMCAAPEPSSRYQGRLRHDVTARLTARQIEVLEQLMKGRSNKQICRELDMAMGTVKSHIAAIFTTLQVNSRTAAMAAVTQVDIVRPTPARLPHLVRPAGQNF